MSGRKSRSKGQRGEREAVALMAAHGFLSARRGWQARSGKDACDVEGTPFFVEVKRGKATNIKAAVRQALAATDGRAVLVLTRDDHGEWLGTMQAPALLAALVREQGCLPRAVRVCYDIDESGGARG